ncbi:hypothetical protein LJC25_02200 [Bacteroidales bacterium OttesenSCG-928-K03]|nr:hypothetical protein [Bacteroidales bacterium OttesenSCG-928-K03]
MANFLNPGKPRQFNIQTRYYDPKKEHERMKEKKAEGKDEEYNEYRRERMRSEWKTNRIEERKSKTQKRLIIYVILAALLLAFILII